MELSQVFLGILIGVLLQGENINSEEIRGIPGVDYPTFFEIPVTSFRCSDQKYIPGFYADPETACQVFHYCYKNRRESYLCPTGTTFNQAILACDYWYSSDCAGATSLYKVNNNYQSRVLVNDVDNKETSNTFGEDETSTYEQAASNIGHEVRNAISNGKKRNQVIPNLKRISSESYSSEANGNGKSNAVVKNKSSKIEGNFEKPKNSEFLRRQESLTQDNEETLVLDGAGKRDYERHSQFVPSSGPELRPLINSSESIYEKLVELYDSDSHFSANKNEPEYTEEQLRSLVEEIRDYEHEMLSRRDENYMFRRDFSKKDNEDYFSGLDESEFNSKLMEHSRKHDGSRINSSENGSFMSEVELDYDSQSHSNVNEDRVNYLHKIRIQDLHPSYPLNSKHVDEERNVDSKQKSEFDDKDFKHEYEKSVLVPDAKDRFSKRLSITEENETKQFRRNPVYVIPESVSEAPKLPSLRKRQRGYPFGIQKSADLETLSITKETVADKTSKPLVEESRVAHEMNLLSSPGSGDIDLNHDATRDSYEEQEELVSNSKNVIPPKEYDSKYSSEFGSTQENIYPDSIDFADEKSGYLQNRNSFNFASEDYDLNPEDNSPQDQWNYVDYAENGFSNIKNRKEHGEIQRVEEGLLSDQEFDNTWSETNKVEIPESTREDYFTRTEEYSGEKNFGTLHPTNSLNQLRTNTKELYFVDYSENEITDAESVYQKQPKRNIPLHSTDAQTYVNNYAGNMKVVGGLYEPVSDETSDTDLGNLPNENDDEMTDSLNYGTDFSEAEENESSLQAKTLESRDSEEASEYVDLANVPQNIYVDPEGNTFYYIDSKMPQDQKHVNAVTPNVDELYIKNLANFTNDDTGDSDLGAERAFEDVQNSGSNILEGKPGMEQAIATNIMKLTDAEFNEFVNSPEFSEVTDTPYTQIREDDSNTESDATQLDFSDADQNEYSRGLIDSLQKDDAEFEYSKQTLSKPSEYQQNIYMDPEGNMFYYIDSETSQESKNFTSETPNNSELQLENVVSSTNRDTTDSGLSQKTMKGCQGSDSNALGSKSDTDLEEAYAENIMKMSDTEFNQYVNSPEFSEVTDIPDTYSNNGYSDSEVNDEHYLKNQDFISTKKTSNLNQSPDFYISTNTEDSEALQNELDESLNPDALQKRVDNPKFDEIFPEENSDFINQKIYTDSEGNMFYYIDTQMPENSENLDVSAQDSVDPISPSEIADVEGHFSPSSSLEGGKPDTGVEETCAENIMQMSDSEFKEYLNSREFSDVTDAPDTRYSEDDAKDNEKARWGNQAIANFKGMEERFESSVDVSDAVRKIPNQFESDSYISTDRNDFLDNRQIEYSGSFREDTFQKRKRTSHFRKNASKKRNSYVNQQNMITDAKGNVFYYYYDTEVPKDHENNGENVGSMSRSAFESDFPPESEVVNRESYFAVPDGGKPLGESYAKNIVEMSDSDFKEYLHSQEFAEVTDTPETRYDDETYVKYDAQQSMNQDVAEVQDDKSEHFRPSIEAVDETAQSMPSEFEHFNSRVVKRNRELSFDEQQSEEDARLNENDEQPDSYESEPYEEVISQDYDGFGSNPENVFVDSEGNMFYYVRNTKVPDHSQNAHFTFETPEEAELSLESTLNSSDSAETDFPPENAIASDENTHLNIGEEEKSDPIAEEAFLRSIMKMSDNEFSAYMNSREFQTVTDSPDIPYNENKSKNGQNCSKSEQFFVRDGMNEEFRRNVLEKPNQFESPDSRSIGKDDSIPELNVFQSGIETQKPANAEFASTGIRTSETLQETKQTVSDNMNEQSSVPLNSETAVESIDINENVQDDYGDFSDLFAALAKEPGMKDQERDNLKLEGTGVQDKIHTDIPPTGVKSTGYQSSKSSGNEFDEQAAFQPSNLDEKLSSEFSQSSQDFNSLQFQRDFGGASNQQYPPFPQQLVKKTLPAQPKRSQYTPPKTREQTFGGTLGSIKKSKLQMLGVYAKALRQRLF